MVDTGADNVDILLFVAQDPGDQMVAALDTVAQAHGSDLAIVVAVPGHHGIGIGVVKQQAVGVGDLPDVPAEALQHGDVPLGIHDTAGTQGVAHALVHTVFQGDVHIRLESFQTADPGAVNNVFGTLQSLPAVQGSLNLDVQAVGFDVPLAQPVNHVQICLVDVHEGHFDIMEFRHGQNVRQKSPGKADGAGADKGKLEFLLHGDPPCAVLDWTHYTIEVLNIAIIFGILLEFFFLRY